MSFRLTECPIGVDSAALTDRLAAGYGGDRAAARATIDTIIAFLARNPCPAPWGTYLAESGGDTVGTCSFKSAPDAGGAVEIAYHTFPAYEGRGHASAMAAALVAIARNAGAAKVVAHTLTAPNPSTYALARSGFTMTGEVDDPEDGLVWRWQLVL